MPTPSSGHMHFSGSGADEVIFGRPANHIYLTVSSSATISFDGGATFMPLVDGTHVLSFANAARISFGAGTWAGVGISF